MSFESASKGLEREELRFTAELGWLGVLAFAILMIVATVVH
jgi:hypothetical protein